MSLQKKLRALGERRPKHTWSVSFIKDNQVFLEETIDAAEEQAEELFRLLILQIPFFADQIIMGSKTSSKGFNSKS